MIENRIGRQQEMMEAKERMNKRLLEELKSVIDLNTEIPENGDQVVSGHLRNTDLRKLGIDHPGKIDYRISFGVSAGKIWHLRLDYNLAVADDSEFEELGKLTMERPVDPTTRRVTSDALEAHRYDFGFVNSDSSHWDEYKQLLPQLKSDANVRLIGEHGGDAERQGFEIYNSTEKDLERILKVIEVIKAAELVDMAAESDFNKVEMVEPNIDTHEMLRDLRVGEEPKDVLVATDEGVIEQNGDSA